MSELWRRIKRSIHLSTQSGDNTFMKVINILAKFFAFAFAIVTGIIGLVPDEMATATKSYLNDKLNYIVYSIFAYFIVFSGYYIASIARHWGDTRKRNVILMWPRLRSTIYESTRKFIDLKDLSENDAVGGAIEVFTHPNNDGGIDDNGWAVDEVQILGNKQPFSCPTELSPEILIPGENGRKYCLVGYATPFKDDSEKLRLIVKRTDWKTIRRALSVIETDENTRHKFADIDPARHEIPNSFCLHIVCLTSENEFLALKRSDSTAYFPGHMSISFEEQFAESDFADGQDSRMKSWFYRALCEEIFPLVGLYSKDPAKAIEIVDEYVSSMRIWSAIYEEPTAGFNLFGVVKLNVAASELPRVFDEMNETHKTKRDIEGRLFFFPFLQIDALLASGHAVATPLLNPDLGPQIVRDLHPTSLYRAARVASCLPR